jgi:hypothetical protein
MYPRMASTAATALKAIRAAGIIVQVDPSVFLDLLARLESPLVVTAHSKPLLSSTYTYQYLTNYKGFAVFAESKQQLQLPEKIELVEAESIWLPSV